jgi:PTH2 family peptidyl-tRNA hydrolase
MSSRRKRQAVVEVEELKMWLAVRTDIRMSRGKLATQAGHAYSWLTVTALKDAAAAMASYLAASTPKISVKAKNEQALRRIETECKAAGIPCYLVVDAGRTEFGGPTPTVIAFGPAHRSSLPKFLQGLQLLKDEEADEKEEGK